VSPSAACGDQRALAVEEVGHMLRATGLEEKERRMSREASPTARVISMVDVPATLFAPPGLSLPHQVICHTGLGGPEVAEDGLDGHEAPLDFGR
jgi:hypothetical protein